MNLETIVELGRLKNFIRPLA